MAKIIVKDVNDNSPIFYPLHYFMDLNSDVIELMATDADENSDVLFKFEKSNQIEFILEENELSINQRYSSLLRSDKSIRELNIIAIDSGGRKSPTLAKVSMYPKNELKNEIFNDKSDNDDYFVVEDNQLREPIIGRQVGQLSLKRTDVTLEITHGDPQNLFEVTNSGLIKTKKVIDREKQDKYTLTIVAKNDQGFDSLKIDIIVKDVNDNIPTFDPNEPSNLLVDLSSPIGHQIHAVKVIDPDIGEY